VCLTTTTTSPEMGCGFFSSTAPLTQRPLLQLLPATIYAPFLSTALPSSAPLAWLCLSSQSLPTIHPPSFSGQHYNLLLYLWLLEHDLQVLGGRRTSNGLFPVFCALRY
jgi:hypothetical protein